MPNQRKKGLKYIGAYVEPHEKKALQARAKQMGVSLSDLIRCMALGKFPKQITLGLKSLKQTIRRPVKRAK